MWQSKRPKLQSPPRGLIPGEGASTSHAGESSSNPCFSGPSLRGPLAGKILSLHMENFMCHSNLEVTFDKRITFVTGMNGSGKSAIMAALIVALGGSANTTGRGVGLADFIKKGTTWARVTIKLNNEGMNSYKKCIYGDQIVIIRTLSKNSSSSYICKSEFGEIVSKKKEEVDRIVTLLDLQIKNPICILNQDVARSFLSTCDSSMRYSMFMKATHLENIKQIYMETEKLLTTSRKDLENKKTAIAEATKEVKYLEKKLACFDVVENKRRQIQFLEQEYLWSLVIEEEKDIRELTNRKTDTERLKNEIYDRRVELDDTINNLSAGLREVEQKIHGFENSHTEKVVQLKALESEMLKLRCQIDNQNSNLNQLISKSERQRSEIETIREHLRKNAELASQSELRRAKYAAKINQCIKELTESRDRMETTQRDNDNAMETRLQHTVALEALRTDLKELEMSKKVLEVQLERGANAGDDALLKYGPFTQKLKELIDEADRKNLFEKKPVGVCGLHVTLSGDSKWARAVESVVGGLMGTYCCDNQKDFQVLSHIMDKTCGGRNPPIIISKFQNSRYNVSGKKVSVEGFETVLDVLQFDNDVVFNTFIDQARIETILLFQTDAEAAALLTHAKNVPKNLRMGLTVHSDQYFPAPNYRTYCGDRNRALKYFDIPAKVEIPIHVCKEELQKTSLAVKEKAKLVAELTKKLNRITAFIKRAEHNLRLFKQNERKIEAEVNRLKIAKEGCPVPPTRVALEEELGILEERQAVLQAKIHEENSNKAMLMKNTEEVSRKIKQITSNESSLTEEVAVLQRQSLDIKEKLAEAKNKRDALNVKINKLQSELNEINTEILGKNEILESKLQKAYEVHRDRIRTEREPAELKSLMDSCKNYIEAAEKNFPPKEEVMGEYEIKLKKYKEIKKTAECMEQVVRSLTANVDEKNEKFTKLLMQMAYLVEFHFQACLRTRGYDGNLEFDFDNQTLDLRVTAKDGVVRSDTKTLSGGERSYSTVSFILAIWRAVQMPFYFLDEFDVFMDKVNRKVIMDLLLDFAKNEEQMQFIFITPQDISSIQTSDSVSIYRMPDPRQ